MASIGWKSRSNIWLMMVFLAAAPVAGVPQVSHSESYTGPMQFRIPAQAMDRALKEFASQSKLQLIFVTDDISAGSMAHEVSGVYAPEAALVQLLAGSCLGYKFVNTRTVAIEALRGRCR